MTLGERQRKFTQLVGQLIGWCYSNGFELTLGEAFRTPEQAALNAQKGSGIANSLHTSRLAIDLNLFKDDVFLTTTDAYKPLGEYWESLDSDCSWGGRFAKPDADHFSLSYNGVR